MKINVTNTEKLAAAIKEVEGRATARCATADGIRNLLDKISSIGMPKTKLAGTVVHWDFGQTFPNAYKWMPESTHWTAEFINGKWYVTDIRRTVCPNCRRGYFYIKYSDSAKAWIIDKASTMDVKFA